MQGNTWPSEGKVAQGMTAMGICLKVNAGTGILACGQRPAAGCCDRPTSVLACLLACFSNVAPVLTGRTWVQAEILQRSGQDICSLHAERETLSACLEEQQRECARLNHAAAAAKEASAADIHRAEAKAEEAILAGASMADALHECRQQLLRAQQQSCEIAQVRLELRMYGPCHPDSVRPYLCLPT